MCLKYYDFITFRFLDGIDNYESQLSKIQQDLDNLKKQKDSTLPVDSYEYGDVTPGAFQSDNSTTISSGDTLPTPPQRGTERERMNDPKARVTAKKTELKDLEDKLKVREQFNLFFVFVYYVDCLF